MGISNLVLLDVRPQVVCRWLPCIHLMNIFIDNALHQPYHIYRVKVENTFFIDGLAGCCNGLL
jgi:hypothetical protein